MPTYPTHNQSQKYSKNKQNKGFEISGNVWVTLEVMLQTVGWRRNNSIKNTAHSRIRENLLFSLYRHFFLLSSSARFNPRRSPGQAVVTGVIPYSPPVRALIFLLRIGFSIPTARRFSSNVANSRSHAFCYSTYMQGKVPTGRIYILCALGENWTHEIDFNRHEDNVPSHRGRRPISCAPCMYHTYNAAVYSLGVNLRLTRTWRPRWTTAVLLLL